MGLIKIEEVLKLVRNLPAGKADDLDGIPACLPEAPISYIATSLTDIFNRSYFCWDYPQ